MFIPLCLKYAIWSILHNSIHLFQLCKKNAKGILNLPDSMRNVYRRIIHKVMFLGNLFFFSWFSVILGCTHFWINLFPGMRVATVQHTSHGSVDWLPFPCDKSMTNILSLGVANCYVSSRTNGIHSHIYTAVCLYFTIQNYSTTVIKTRIFLRFSIQNF